MYCDQEVKKVPGGESLIYSYDVRWMFLGPVFVNWIRIARYIYDLFMLYTHCIFIIDEIITLTIKLLLHPYNWSYFLLTESTKNWVQAQPSQTQYVNAQMLKVIHLLILHNVAFYRVYMKKRKKRKNITLS